MIIQLINLIFVGTILIFDKIDYKKNLDKI